MRVPWSLNHPAQRDTIDTCKSLINYKNYFGGFLIMCL